MERGPMALFGALVAVGLGPSLWLGAQVGEILSVPTAPPAVTVERDNTAGEGAAAKDDRASVVRTDVNDRPRTLTNETTNRLPRNNSRTKSPVKPQPSAEAPPTAPTEEEPPVQPPSADPAEPEPTEPSEGGTTTPAPTDPPAESAEQPPAGLISALILAFR